MVNKTFYTFRKRSSLQIINSQGIGYIINQTTIWPALYLNKTDRSPRESLRLVSQRHCLQRIPLSLFGKAPACGGV